MCSNNKADQYFCDFCTETALVQQITEPTYHGTRDSLLDILLTNQHGNNSLLSSTTAQPICDKCDHDALVAKIRTKSSKNYDSTKPNLCFQKADYNLISSHLRSIDWESVIKTGTVNYQTSYDNFVCQLQSVINDYVPKRFYRKGFKLPKYLRRLAKTKSLLYKKKKSDLAFKPEYVKASKLYEKEVKAWFSSVEEKVCSSRNPTNLLKYVNRKLKLKTDIPSVLNIDGKTITDDLMKANHFNEQFTSVFQTDDGNSLNLHEKTSTYLEHINISSEDISQAILKIKPKTSKTPDSIPPIFLKNAGKSLIPALKQLFQSSLDNGTLPKEWKTALINPVHKKGSKNDVLNYRPISLTSSLCRLLESIIKTYILIHLYENNLISPKQHGFLPGRSTCTQLLTTLNTVMQNFDQKRDVHIVYTDFSKAFDKVCHNKLIQVLSSYGIKGRLLCWIKNFITHRSQAVYIGEATSGTKEITSGVPQGSVLAPLLFSLYVQRIESTCFPGCDVGLFADDCKFISSDERALQNTLDNMTRFVAERQLVLSKAKCSHLPITRQGTDCHFYLEGDEVPAVDSIRDLGIILTSDLKWKAHITTITQRAFHKMHLILFSFTTSNVGVLLLAYKSFVRPILESGSVIWNPYLIGNTDKLESVQLQFTRRLFQRCGLSSSNYDDRLQKLNLKSLEHRRLAIDLVMLYKILNNLVDIDSEQLFTFKESRYDLRGNSLTLNKPKTATNTAFNFFTSRVVRLWNALPDEIVTSRSVYAFKRQVNNLDLVKIKKSLSLK